MSSTCDRIIASCGSSLGRPDLGRNPWYLIVGRGGPNAVLKIVLPPARRTEGYVLTVARHADTPVIRHEVSVLDRLQRSLPTHLAKSIPTVLAHGHCDGTAYFGIRFYRSCGRSRVTRRWNREKRLRWVVQWLTELASGTLQRGLTQEWLEAEYATTVSRIQADPAVANDVKQRVQESFELICRNAGRIPSVCCHGDIWAGNILWRRRSSGAVILDWGAARWPGLPCVDLCRFLLANNRSHERIAAAVRGYCQAIDLDPSYVPPLFDLYNVFIKAELDLAYAMQPADRFDPFLSGLPSQRLSLLPPT